MTREHGKKQIDADVPAALHEELKQWIADHKNGTIRQCVQACLEWWLALPEDVQAITLTTSPDKEVFQDAVKTTVTLIRRPRLDLEKLEKLAQLKDQGLIRTGSGRSTSTRKR